MRHVYGCHQSCRKDLLPSPAESLSRDLYWPVQPSISQQVSQAALIFTVLLLFIIIASFFSPIPILYSHFSSVSEELWVRSECRATRPRLFWNISKSVQLIKDTPTTSFFCLSLLTATFDPPLHILISLLCFSKELYLIF